MPDQGTVGHSPSNRAQGALQGLTTPATGNTAPGLLPGAAAMARAIAGGALDAQTAVRQFLDRCATHEPQIHAWAWLDPDHAMAQARSLDAGPHLGPLQGIPLGVKDVIDTFDMPTAMGSPIYAGHRPPADAACVAIARAAGAVIMGKTVTAEFAGSAPGPTVNPHDPARTPGGSSSGSAAAVAAGMVPAAFGTQTGGSVLRPAAFCGVVGFKPGFGRWNRTGIKPHADSLDTAGALATTLEDIELLDAVMTGRPATLEHDAEVLQRLSAPRIGLCRTHLWDQAAAETVEAIEDAASRLAAAGASISEVALPTGFGEITRWRRLLASRERALAMTDEWHRHRILLSPILRQGIEQGLAVDGARYAEALAFTLDQRVRSATLFDDCDILLTPCAMGEAPTGLESTGDPRFQEIWTLLHLPALSLPTHRGPRGMPVAIQLVGQRQDDQRLIALARWVMHHLGHWQNR
jgi:amidase